MTKTKILAFTCALAFIFPAVVLASQDDTGGGGTNSQEIPTPAKWLYSVPLLSGLPGGGVEKITGNIIPFAVSVVLALLIIFSLFFLLIGGVRWIISGGDKEGLAKAKGTVTYAIIGLVLGLASFTIISVVSNLFNVDLGLGLSKGQNCMQTCIQHDCPTTPSSCSSACRQECGARE